MKIVIYAKLSTEDTEGFRTYEITESGKCPDNCDAITAIGRLHSKDEIVGYGDSEKTAFEDAILSI